MRQTLRLVFINLGVLASLFLAAELLARGYEAVTYQPKYQNDLERNLDRLGESCVQPPIVTESGDLSRYSEDFSCGGVTIANGLRLTANQPEQPSLTVHVFGGSTVFGLGSTDDETIPSQLQRLINQRGLNAAVKNYGFITLVSAQQKAALANADIKEGDVVVFYDGGNDAFNSFVYGSPEGTIIGYNRQNRLSFALVEVRHFLQSHSAFYRQLGAIKARAAGKNDPSTGNCIETPSQSDRVNYVDHYFDVLTASKQLAESKGALFFHAFQPILGSSNGLSTDKPQKVQSLLDVDGISLCTQEALLEYYKGLGFRYDESIDDFNGLNLSRIFHASAEGFDSRYIDWIHMTPEANQVIADQLMNHISLALSPQ